MIKKIRISVFIVLALILPVCLKAQEQLMPLHGNAQLTTLPAKNLQASRTASISALDTLPFFEDFSYSTRTPYPSPKHWLDSNVFINHTFPIAPPSVGVATFDGLNKYGYPYNISALVSSSLPADKLTSRQINMQKDDHHTFQPSDSIYFSFYFQAEGRGDSPEPNDSLSLDFYKPNQKKWEKVWGVKGYNPSTADSSFHLVMLAVKDSAYFDSLFQFRFRNRATISGSLDHWHVDYIFIDRNRSYVDTIMEDDAFEYMSSSFLKDYSTMPYRQYLTSAMAPNIQNYIRNNFTIGKNISYNYSIFDVNNVSVGSYNGGSANIPPYKPSGLHTFPGHASPAVSYAFPAPMTSMGIYTIKHVISSSPDLQRQNDTIYQTQRFSDYYAYDDGTAEVGYYNNTYGAKNAVRYTLYAKDTLRAMRIYFDPVTDGQLITGSTFNIYVWRDDVGGPPGSILYSDSSNNESHPVYLQGKYNFMPTFSLSQCVPMDEGTYYFGIKQKTNQPLNIGFDKNTDHSNAFFYDIGDGWTQSSIKGSIMINPLFGCALDPLPSGIQTHEEKTGMSIFPNPAQNSISIETNGIVLENATVGFMSSLGQTMHSVTYNSNQTIDISSLPNGVYFVHLSSKELNAKPQKLIIAR